jgi:uncharacterized protein YeaO (DUF488 family)
MEIKIKRAYEEVDTKDGTRVLVDRLWPRGLTKDKAAIDLWLKDIAPSTELRRWFGHDPEKWKGFQRRYRTELRHNDAALETLRRNAEGGTVTLIYAARDEQHNEARVLKQFLESEK